MLKGLQLLLALLRARLQLTAHLRFESRGGGRGQEAGVWCVCWRVLTRAI